MQIHEQDEETIKVGASLQGRPSQGWAVHTAHSLLCQLNPDCEVEGDGPMSYHGSPRSIVNNLFSLDLGWLKNLLYQENTTAILGG